MLRTENRGSVLANAFVTFFQPASPILDTSSDTASSLLAAYHGMSSSAGPSPGTTTTAVLDFDSALAEAAAAAAMDLPCNCLSKIHFTLSELQFMTNFGFPMALKPLTNGKRTASEVLQCSQCLKDGSSAMQNTMLLTTLLSVLLNHYRKVLVSIEEDAARIEAASGTIPFRMGDNSPALQHLHDGTPDCPVGFNIDLAPQEWRYLAKRAFRAEVKGASVHGDGSIVDIITQLETRQRKWHEDWHARGNCLRCWHASGGSQPGVPPHTDENCVHYSESNPPGEDPTCFKVTQLLRDMLDWPEWSQL